MSKGYKFMTAGEWKAQSYQLADVKLNNGRGALLCNDCRIIIATGFDHEDKLHYCDECSKKIVDIPK